MQDAVIAVESKVDHIPMVLVALDAHLQRPSGPYPNFIAIANGDISVYPDHPWLERAGPSTDHRETERSRKAEKSTPLPTILPQKKAKRQRSGHGSEKRIPTEGGSDTNMAATSTSNPSKRRRRLQLPHQPSTGDESKCEGELQGRSTFQQENHTQPPPTNPLTWNLIKHADHVGGSGLLKTGYLRWRGWC